MAGTADNVIVDANGDATVTLQNPSTVKGLRIENLAVQIANEDSVPNCEVFNGFAVTPNRIAATGVGHDDVAVGPYYLPPGGFLTVVWNGATPGLSAHAWLTSSPVSLAPVDLGTLRFAGAVGSGRKLVGINELDAVAVGVGVSRVIDFSPPDGKLWRITGMRLFCNPPGGAASGTHRFEVRTVGETTVFITQGSSGFANTVRFEWSEWKTTVAPEPVDDSATLIALYAILIDPLNPLRVVYVNLTNVVQNNARTIVFTMEESQA